MATARAPFERSWARRWVAEATVGVLEGLPPLKSFWGPWCCSSAWGWCGVFGGVWWCLVVFGGVGGGGVGGVSQC